MNGKRVEMVIVVTSDRAFLFLFKPRAYSNVVQIEFINRTLRLNLNHRHQIIRTPFIGLPLNMRCDLISSIAANCMSKAAAYEWTLPRPRPLTDWV